MSAGFTVHIGDCIEAMRTMPAGSIHTCVTSPPYFGLRDYGHAGQIGLEATPDAYVAQLVAVFREVRRVLRDDGTLWLNLGDSYAADRGYQVTQTKGGPKHGPAQSAGGRSQRASDYGLKPKDLIGVPWMVARALRAPYYTGRIRDERDRIWLAAMIDAEGCMFIHKRKAGTDSGAKWTKADGTEVSYARTKDTYGSGLEVANTSEAIVARCQQITGIGSICRQDKDRRQPLYRWNVRSNECRWIVEEVYPYLVAKQHQARLLLGCPSSGKDAERAHGGLIALHNGSETDVDFKPPAPLFQPGFYLRQDLIWSKLNPMPESVRDRCTKAHEYLFLLSKGPRYYFDAAAVAEPLAASSVERLSQSGLAAQAGSDRVPGKTNGNMKAVGPRFGGNKYGDDVTEQSRTKSGNVWEGGKSRNRRSVWTVTTKPFKGAHFATFPPDLIEPCILAGCPHGGTVLDPFGGSGTTAGVAIKHGRNAILCELNPDYAALVPARVQSIAGAQRDMLREIA